MNPMLERLRATWEEANRPRLPSPDRLSVTRMAMETRWAYDRDHRLDRMVVEERLFPEIVQQVREKFMMDVKFSVMQFHWFADWIEQNGIPLNLHCVSHRYWEGDLKDGASGKKYRSRCYIVRLMDIHWMWMEMA